MKNISIYTLITSFLFLIYSPMLAQRGPQSSWGTSGGKVKVVGKVLDEAGEKGLEYATVNLLQTTDSSFVAGIVTDEKGSFELEANAGKYILKISFIGFETQYISDIQLNDENPLARINEIRLQTKATTLNEVEIQAERSRMEFSLDKKVFNVGKDLANNGGTAADLLDNVPSVNIDVEGNVNLRGSSGVRILINGKESGFASINPADALKQLQANMIEKVEIVTNPSAKYEAEGTAGVINIVLKKERKKGWNGSFNLTGGLPQNHNAAINLNHRRDQFNFFATVGGRYRRTPSISNEYREITNNGILNIMEQEGLTYRNGYSGNIQLGADYSFNKFTTLTGSVLYRMGRSNDDGEIKYNRFNATKTFTGLDLRTTEELEDDYSLDYSLNFVRTFARKGQKLTADIIYTSGGEEESMDAREQAFDGALLPIGSPDLLQRVNNNENQNQLTLRTDYVHPFGKDGKFEAGYRGSIRNIDNTYKVEEYDNELAFWETLSNLSNDFAYDEEIHAAYATFGDKINKFNYQVGLRAEYTHIKTQLLTTGEKNDKTYANLFPSVFLNYELKPGNALQLSYSRRLRRPRFWELNPFFTFTNPLSIWAGNPDLDPEFTHSLEAGNIKYWEKASLSTSIYYRHTEGEISRLSRVDSNGVNIRRPENLATRDDIGAEFSLNLTPLKWWDLTLSANVYKGKINAENLGFSGRTDFFSFTSRLNSRMSFPKLVDVQTMISFRGGENTPQGRRKAMLSTDLALSKDVMKKNATLSFRISDIFNSRIYRSIIEGEGFFIERESQWRATRQVYLGFTYRLNQKKRRGRERSYNDFGGEGR